MGSTPRIFPNEAATSYEGFFLQADEKTGGLWSGLDFLRLQEPPKTSKNWRCFFRIVMEESQVTLDCMGQVSELSNPRQLQMSLFDLTLAGAGQLLQETQDEGLEEVDLI